MIWTIRRVFDFIYSKVIRGMSMGYRFRCLIATLCAFFMISLSAIAQDRMIWHDEFNGRSLTPKVWNIEMGTGLWGNRELQTYTKRNAISFEDGCLVITARKGAEGSYTSGRINTKGKVAFKYGRVEARIKLPYGNGMWPAFWMMGADIDEVGHPACGEIDIVEMVGGTSPEPERLSDSVVHGALHRSDGPGIVSSTGFFKGDAPFSDDFHVFGIRWSSASITYYVDDHDYFTVPIGEDAAFHKEYFLLLNLAVGGIWPGPPTATTVWPQKMYVDWVRVYTDR